MPSEIPRLFLARHGAQLGPTRASERVEPIITACPTEKSGQDEFDFEYGSDFARHLEEFQPTFCKVLGRYNPEGNKDLGLELDAQANTSCLPDADVAHPGSRGLIFVIATREDVTMLREVLHVLGGTR